MYLQPQHVEALRRRVIGEVATPDDDRWDAARQLWNVSVEMQPDLVVLPESSEDVVAIVEFAGEYGLRIAPKNGHGSAFSGSLASTILLDTTRLRA